MIKKNSRKNGKELNYRCRNGSFTLLQPRWRNFINRKEKNGDGSRRKHPREVQTAALVQVKSAPQNSADEPVPCINEGPVSEFLGADDHIVK